MRCAACGVLLHDADDYCRRCGARAPDEHIARRAASDPQPRRRLRRRRGRHEESEEVLWEGTYALKAMFREASVAVVLTVALPMVLGAAGDAQLQRYTFPAVAIVWLLLAGLAIYRKWDVWYQVSNQRLFHEDGIFYRRINRIEIIDIDDLRCEQGLIERLLNVGRILVRSSDHTHPDLIMEGIEAPRHVFEIIDAARRQERLKHGLHVEAI